MEKSSPKLGFNEGEESTSAVGSSSIAPEKRKEQAETAATIQAAVEKATADMIAEYEKLLEEVKKENDTLQETAKKSLIEIEESVEALKTSLLEKEQEIKDAKNKIEKYKNKNEEKKDKIEKTKEELVKVQDALEKANNKLEKYKKAYKKQKAKIEKLENESSSDESSSSEYSSGESSSSEYSSGASSRSENSELEDMKAKLDSAEKRAETAEEDLKKIKAKLDSAKNRAKTAEEDLKKINDFLEEVCAKFEIKLDSLDVASFENAIFSCFVKPEIDSAIENERAQTLWFKTKRASGVVLSAVKSVFTNTKNAANKAWKFVTAPVRVSGVVSKSEVAIQITGLAALVLARKNPAAFARLNSARLGLVGLSAAMMVYHVVVMGLRAVLGTVKKVEVTSHGQSLAPRFAVKRFKDSVKSQLAIQTVVGAYVNRLALYAAALFAKNTAVSTAIAGKDVAVNGYNSAYATVAPYARLAADHASSAYNTAYDVVAPYASNAYTTVAPYATTAKETAAKGLYVAYNTAATYASDAATNAQNALVSAYEYVTSAPKA